MKFNTLIHAGAAALALTFFGLESCSDPCKDVVCQNAGTCNEEDGSCNCPENFYGPLCQTECINGTYENGNCVCDDYYEGDACDTEERIKFYGAYDVDEDCGSNGSFTYASTIKANSGNIYKVEISKLYQEFSNPIIAEVDGYDITIASQQPEDGFTISGSGSMSADGTEITITYTLNDVSIGSANCTVVFTRQ
jgi:hypothetical protein